jgi:hypothetical protein
VTVSYKLPPWLIHWLRRQQAPAAQLIETALCAQYGLKPPTPGQPMDGEGEAQPRPGVWTAEELAVIREHYPKGGADACRPHLPNRSREAIKCRASTIKVRCR